MNHNGPPVSHQSLRKFLPSSPPSNVAPVLACFFPRSCLLPLPQLSNVGRGQLKPRPNSCRWIPGVELMACITPDAYSWPATQRQGACTRMRDAPGYITEPQYGLTMPQQSTKSIDILCVSWTQPTKTASARPEAQQTPKDMRPSLEGSRCGVDWLPFAPSMSKQDNNARPPEEEPSPSHHAVASSLSIPNSTPPCSMTSSFQILGFSRTEGRFESTVMCCQRGMQSSAPVLHLNPSTLSAVSIVWRGTLTQPSSSSVPPSTRTPVPLGLVHTALVETADQDGRLSWPCHGVSIVLEWRCSLPRPACLALDFTA
ncbi:hypothetical protein CI238_01506 [Colletotrichum incanum]|uniref:Uncharacterized protein n=1 Tax=Colletotrichum incanum TaxID=1573173 RepID=A0A166SF21_COLIC|nr:hypothetical protein CI238_01506 [Colletotrichum incanum]